MVKLIQSTEQIVPYFKELGFRYVTLDLMGYKRGSLNEGLIQLDQIS
jgi:PP-loop superfamily ATP-utilizing enzyme